MPFVEFYKLQNDGTQKVVATCKLQDQVTVCEGDPALISALEREGVYDYAQGGRDEKLFPKDGMRFLEQLKFNFKSGYLNASEIKNK